MTNSIQQVDLFYANAYHEASIHDPKKGQVSGFSKKEYNDLCNYLNGKIKEGGEVGEYAQKKLDELNYLKDCPFNKLDLKNSKPGFFKSLFNKEKSLKRENVISHDTMLLNNGGKLKQANHYIEMTQDNW